MTNRGERRDLFGPLLIIGISVAMIVIGAQVMMERHTILISFCITIVSLSSLKICNQNKNLRKMAMYFF